MPRLENWSIKFFDDNPFIHPKFRNKYLCGNIYDDEKGRFADGKQVYTSSIQKLNLDERYVQTRNTRYILGETSEEYMEWLKSEGIELKDMLK